MNLPLNDKFAARVALYQQQRDPLWHNLLNDTRMGSIDHQGLRLHTLWQINPTDTLLLTYQQGKDRSSRTPYLSIGYWDAQGSNVVNNQIQDLTAAIDCPNLLPSSSAAFNAPNNCVTLLPFSDNQATTTGAGNWYETYDNAGDMSFVTFDNLKLKYQAEFNWGKLTSITAVDNVDSGYMESLNNMPQGLAFMPAQMNEKRQFTHEINENITPKAFLHAIVPYSNAPICSYWVTFIGDGVVGGYLLDPLVQGTSIIQIVLGKLSTGNINQTLPFASWMIDQQQADKYNIAIPENIQPQYIFNRDTNILIDYPLESGSLLGVLAVLGIGLFWVRQIKLGGAIRVAEQSKRQALRSAIKATRSSEAKSKFLANISHEIRTPINGMFGVLNILSKTTLNKEQINLLQMGRFCTETLLRTVNDVLDFSKLESRQLQLKQIGFSPVQLLKESYAYGLLISDEQPITIELQIDKLIDVPLLGDQTRLRQIFDNLISNAVNFTDHGNIVIGATITPEDSYYKLTCWKKDPGEGISEADLKRLFQPFVQIEDSYTKTRSGTGLGLALCKELIALMQGDIHMESTEGIGTEVVFSVTLLLAEEITLEEPETLQIDFPVLQHANILFVEDNPINQEITIVQLQHYGITMTVMNNGKECVDHLLTSAVQYDVILMDIQMPIMNGYQASQAIRRGEAGTNNANIPIIALTAHVSLEEQQKALQAGMNKHINKPIVPELLLKAIHDCIQTQKNR